MRAALAIATAAFAAAGMGVGTARADVEINLGSFSPAGCAASSVGTDEGRICGPTVALTDTIGGNLDIFDLSAFSDHFHTVADLTFKPGAGSSLLPLNPPDESGFGENGLRNNSCTDTTNCEISGNASVALSSTVGLIDAVVGSAQAGEDFTVWAGDTLATLAPVGTGSGCDVCTVNFSPAKIVGVTSNGTGDVLLAGISVPSAAEVPEPASLALFGTGLLGLGFIARRRRPSR